MSPAARHIVRRVVLELDLGEQPDVAARRQAQAAELCRRRLADTLDRCLAAYGGGDTLYRLDRLEIEIPDVDPERLEMDWADKVEYRLHEALRAALQGAAREDIFTASAGVAPTIATGAADLLLYFFRYGLLPWWADTSARQAVQRAFYALLQMPAGPSRLWQGIGTDPAARKRLFRDIPDAGLIAFFQQLFDPAPGAPLARAAADAGRQPGWAGRRVQFWEAAAAQVLSSRHEEATSAPPNKQPNAPGVVKISAPSHEESTPAPPARTAPKEQPNGPGAAQVSPPRAPEMASAPRAAAFDHTGHLYPDNAGVILLAPFLSRLWTQLGWATERGFADTDTAWLAVQLIQYLCDGQAETPPEYCLALPKILCGFRPDAVFEPPRALNDAERTEGDALLQAVLEHVPGLGLKTTGALRGSFLMRRGVLRPGDFQWLLTVEKETYDIVLQKVPWGFQVLKFPWMAVAVFVEWEV
jgi:hypothetical protein